MPAEASLLIFIFLGICFLIAIFSDPTAEEKARKAAQEKRDKEWADYRREQQRKWAEQRDNLRRSHNTSLKPERKCNHPVGTTYSARQRAENDNTEDFLLSGVAAAMVQSSIHQDDRPDVGKSANDER